MQINSPSVPPLPDDDIDLDMIDAFSQVTESKIRSLTAATVQAAEAGAPESDGTPLPPLSPFDLTEEQLSLCSGEHYLSHRPPSYEYLLKGSLRTNCVGLIAGPPGAGKGMLALQMCVSVAGGLPLLGTWEASAPGPVLYISGEDDEVTIHKRFYNYLDKLKSDPEHPISEAQARTIAANFYGIPITGGVPLVSVVGSEAKMSRHWEVFRQKVLDVVAARAGARPKLIVLDTLSCFVRTPSENDNSIFTLVFGQFDRLAKELCCNIIFLHHVSKDGGGDCIEDYRDLPKALTQTAARGASSIIASARWLLMLAPLGAGLAKKLIGAEAEGKPDGSFVAIRVSKNNCAPQQHRFYLQRVRDGLLEKIKPDPDSATKPGPKNNIQEDAQSVLDFVRQRKASAPDKPVAKNVIGSLLDWGKSRTARAVDMAIELDYIVPIKRKGRGGGQCLVLPEDDPALAAEEDNFPEKNFPKLNSGKFENASGPDSATKPVDIPDAIPAPVDTDPAPEKNFPEFENFPELTSPDSGTFDGETETVPAPVSDLARTDGKCLDSPGRKGADAPADALPKEDPSLTAKKNFPEFENFPELSGKVSSDKEDADLQTFPN